MTDKQIGVGIIGVESGRSWSAVAHIPALRSLPQYKLLALSTRRQESADAAARAAIIRPSSRTPGQHGSNSGVRLPSRVRSGRPPVPPIGPARQERAKIHTDLFHGWPSDIPPPVIDLVDTQVAVE